MLKKRGFIEFSWIFALIVGVAILFLAFYFIGAKFTEKKVVSSTQVEHSLDIILNPFSSFGGLGATSAKVIELKKAEKINFFCDSSTSLGYDSISVTTDLAYGSEKKVYDKYIFAENFTEGKSFQIISKPFSMPWRVADLIYFIPKDKTYCFVKFPNIDDEFGEKNASMNISNFRFVDSPYQCDQDKEGEVVSVCNGMSGCNITVYGGEGKITKSSGPPIYFVDDALMYAAIFSDSEIYNCNLRRLAKRIQNQADVFTAKSLEMGKRCPVSFNLGSLKQAAGDLSNANGIIVKDKLIQLKGSAEIIKSQNMGVSCHLF